MTQRTTLFGGPMAGATVELMTRDITLERTFMHMPHVGGPICYITRRGSYRAFALVPTAALWVWDDRC